MGDLLLFPTPAGHEPNHTDETSNLRGCWACGLLLFDDEPSLCADCDLELNRPPTPTPPGTKPLGFYLKPFGPDGIAQMSLAIIEAGVTHTEEAAASWARDHHLDPRAHATYVGDVRGRALSEYSVRCQQDAQQLGVQLGWTKTGAR